MQKLTLNLDELRVEGFSTVALDAPSKGTVLGNAGTLICTGICTEKSCGHICP